MSGERDSIDGLQLGALILQESMRIQSALSRIATLPLQQVRPVAEPPAESEESETGRDDPMHAAVLLLRQAERLLMEHPVLSQRAFASLAAEGRRFAKTTEGARWERALEDSNLVQKARRIWSGSLLNVLEESPDARLPTAYLELLFNALRAGDHQIDEVLGSLGRDAVGPKPADDEED